MPYDFSSPVSFLDFLNAHFRNCNKLAWKQKFEIACIAELSRRSFTRKAMINIKTKLQNQKEAKTTNVQANMHLSLPLQFTPANCAPSRVPGGGAQLFRSTVFYPTLSANGGEPTNCNYTAHVNWRLYMLRGPSQRMTERQDCRNSSTFSLSLS